MDTMKASYPDYQSAINAGAVGEGRWVPAFLPQSARDIQEQHDIDTNEVWLFFRFDSHKPYWVTSDCNKTERHAIPLARWSPGRWWPDTLVQGSEGGQQSDATYDYYRCKDGILAIEVNKNEAFFWYLGG